MNSEFLTSIEHAVKDLLAEARTESVESEQFVFLVAEIPGDLPPGSLPLAYHRMQPAFVWRPAEQEQFASSWQITALGNIATISASGAGRFGIVRDRARELFSRIQVPRRAKQYTHLLRMVGGASFHSDAEPAPHWTAFGCALFFLPRWQIATNGAQTVLTFAAKAEELECSAFLEQQRLFWASILMERIHRASLLNDAGQAGDVRANDIGDIAADMEQWRHLATGAIDTVSGATMEKLVVSRESQLRGAAPFEIDGIMARLEHHAVHSTRFMLGQQGSFFVGASPERLVSVMDDARHILADALAGSRERTSPPGALADTDALSDSDKETREFAYVRDAVADALVRLGFRLHPPGDVSVKSLANIHHLYTLMSGDSTAAVHALTAVDALHPTPAVCGVPSSAARQWLQQNETYNRGWYAGPVGWFDAAGNGDFVVAIRSALIVDDTALVFAGAGIVAGSNWEDEYRETQVKQHVMRDALGGVQDES